MSLSRMKFVVKSVAITHSTKKTRQQKEQKESWKKLKRKSVSFKMTVMIFPTERQACLGPWQTSSMELYFPLQMSDLVLRYHPFSTYPKFSRACVRVRIRRLEMVVFRKIWVRTKCISLLNVHLLWRNTSSKDLKDFCRHNSSVFFTGFKQVFTYRHDNSNLYQFRVHRL